MKKFLETSTSGKVIVVAVVAILMLAALSTAGWAANTYVLKATAFSSVADATSDAAPGTLGETPLIVSARSGDSLSLVEDGFWAIAAPPAPIPTAASTWWIFY